MAFFSTFGILFLAAAANIALYFLRPKPKRDLPEIQDLEAPTAESGRPVPVLFGTVRVRGLNVINQSDTGGLRYKVRA